jgi:hypothetical protein
MVAHQYGHDTWAGLETALARPNPSGQERGPSPPFYRIDQNHNTIEPQEPLSPRDWETIFGVMREQGVTGIRTRGAMTDAAMTGLSQLEFVTSISVEGGQGFTDDGLLRLVGMPQLEALDLSGWHSRLTDRGLDVLRHLPRLRRFAMSWGQHLTDAGAANLRHCEALERVDLMGTPTGDGVLEALRGKRRLSELNTGTHVTDDGLVHLHELPVFTTPKEADFKTDLMADRAPTHNVMLDGPFTDRGLASLRGLEGLHGLSLFWHAHAFTGEGLASLANLPNLCVLGCQGARCDDAAMRSIGRLPGMRGLMAQGTVASDDGFVALSTSQSIEYIWGRECPNLHGSGLVALANMASLRGLGVSCKGVDDESLAALSRFPALRQLMPMDVDNAGFRHVGACEQLEDLFCMYCREMGDEATEHIAHLRLKSYYAGGTKMTDRSLELLARMTSLEKVELRANAGITDSGVATLSALPHLREITIGDSPRVSARGMAVFGAQVRVDYEP